MVQVGLRGAKNKLSELFTRALHGETVVTTRQGENQSIHLTPIPQAAKGFGMLREQLAICRPVGIRRKQKQSSFNGLSP